MAAQSRRPWVTAIGTPLHIGLAVPWALEAAAILLLASTGDAAGPLQLAAIPAALAGVGVFLARQWWLVAAAIFGAIAGFAGGIGIGLNYIDHSPGSELAQFALNVTWAAFVAGLISSGLAIVVGVLEWRAVRRLQA